MKLRGGVIIIGSLLWDNENRKKWRENSLISKDRFRVYLPIRYGRLSCSKKRKNTYTMVFSTKCYSKRYGLGIGWILPIKDEINSFDGLKKEACKMGKAEYFDEENNWLFSDWGSVALLLNPNKKIDSAIKDNWRELLSGNKDRKSLMNTHLKSEKPAIDSDGFLAIRWPDEVKSKNRIKKLDFLIATVTLPTLSKGRYPTAYKIADAMKNAKYCNYFKKNREHEITTFQDERIARRVKQTCLFRT